MNNIELLLIMKLHRTAEQIELGFPNKNCKSQ